MKKIALGMLLSAGWWGVAFAQTVPVIDPTWKAVDEQLRAQEQSDCQNLPIIKKLHCRAALRQTYENNGQIPGTEHFIRKNYGGLSVSQLNAAIQHLNVTYYGKVRTVSKSSFSRPEVGELTANMIERDIAYLRRLINEKGGMPNPLGGVFGKTP